MHALLTFLFFLTGAVHVDRTDLTAGVLCTENDNDFRGRFYPEKVPLCTRHLTNRTKNMVAQRYQISKENYKYYEFDHYIPVALGGSNSPANIWPQLLSEAREKDVLEVKLYRLLKSGKILQKDAVRQIMAWRNSQ